MPDADYILPTLLARGDQVSIENGRLVIKPASGRPVPEDWFKRQWLRLVEEICAHAGADAYRFVEHTTGRYGPYKSPGLTLHYESLLTACAPRITFNVGLKRIRSTRTAKAGDALPAGQFTVGRRHAFTRYWRSLDLPMPDRLSAFHKKLHHHRRVLVTGQLTELEQSQLLDKTSIKPLHISPEYLEAGNKTETSWEQEGNKAGTRNGNKESAESQQPPSLQPSQSTGTGNYGNKGKGERVAEDEVKEIQRNDFINKPVQQWTTEQWLCDYEGKR